MKLFCNGSAGADLTTYPLYWLNAAGTKVVRLVHRSATGIEKINVEYSSDGTTWTAIGTEVDCDMTATAIGVTFDFRIICNSTAGLIEVYSGGTRILTSATANPTGINLSGIPQISQFRPLGGHAGGFGFQINFSEVIIATVPTIGWRLLTRYPAGNSATNTAWTGSYTDIDETVFNDSDTITSNTASQVETYTTSGPSLPSGYFVKAIGVYARGKNDGSGVANIDMAIRATGANYVSGTKTLDLGYTAVGNIWETDPSTSAVWDNAQVDAIEVGVKSI
jgi:hypothetical protein